MTNFICKFTCEIEISHMDTEFHISKFICENLYKSHMKSSILEISFIYESLMREIRFICDNEFHISAPIPHNDFTYENFIYEILCDNFY